MAFTVGKAESRESPRKFPDKASKVLPIFLPQRCSDLVASNGLYTTEDDHLKDHFIRFLCGSMVIPAITYQLCLGSLGIDVTHQETCNGFDDFQSR